MEGLKRAIVAAHMAVGLLVALPAKAQDFNGPYVGYTLNGSSVFQQTDQVVSAATANSSGSGPGTSLTAQAGVGFASYSLTTDGTSNPIFLMSAWRDQIVINAPGQSGLGGVFTFQLNYSSVNDLLVAAGFNGIAQPSFYAGLTPLDDPNAGQTQRVDENLMTVCTASDSCSVAHSWGASGTSAAPTFADGTATFTFDVQFGRTYTLDIGILEFDSASGFASTRTLRWGGTVGMTDLYAQPLTQYTLTSAIGLDYASAVAAVPEPASMVLMAAGLMLLTIGRRRTR